jgi:subtilisin family serine protease
MALIAGRANTDHPALAGASIKQFDARRHARKSAADDFTTAHAALLVAPGSASAYRGVARQAHLLVLHVLDDRYMTTNADLLAAVDAAITEGAQVICLPLGGLAKSEVERTAYGRAADLGVVIACPAGNDGGAEPVYPAAYPDCVSAGAVDAHGRLAEFSNVGDWVTTTAPGVGVSVAVGKDRYATWSGTSFSCSILAGTVALMLKVNPKLTPHRVREILRRVGPPVLLNAESTKVSGNLRVLDACEAVREAREKVTVRPTGHMRSSKESRRGPGAAKAADRSRSD